MLSQLLTSTPLSRVASDESASSFSSAGSWSSEIPAISLRSGNYHLLSALGKGSSATVYEGLRDGQAKRTRFAIKIARSSKTDFGREALLQNAVARHSASVFPVIEDRLADGRSALLMPCASNIDRLAGKCSNTMIKWIISDIGGALVTSHALGIAHGDIKPEQILAARRQGGESRTRFFLGDFGFASTHRITMVKGSPAFMSESVYRIFRRWRADSEFWEMFADEEERYDPVNGIAIDAADADVYAFAFSILVLLVGDHVAHFETDEALAAWHNKLRYDIEWTLASLGLSHHACEVLSMALSPNRSCPSMRRFVEAALDVDRWIR